MGNFDDFTNLPLPDPEEERAEQLEDYIEALEAGQHPALPDNLGDEDADAFAMATLFHAASGADEPDPSFIAALEARLMASPNHHEATLTRVQAAPRQPTQATEKPARQTSRRRVLAGGLAAAAGLAAGLAGGVLIERAQEGGSSTWTALVPNGVWQTIASVSNIAPGTVTRFSTPALAGHLIRRLDGSFYALSAACTHMGCLVNWNPAGDSFDCPCHNGRFNADGTALTTSQSYRPLPGIQIQVVGDEVQAFVPASDTSGTGGTSGTSTAPSAPWSGH
jgi:Rieske Fe-S protein